MKKINLILVATAIVSLSLHSCNNSSVKTVEKLQSGYEYEGEKVELTGEFDAPFFTFSSGRSQSIPMAFVVKASAVSSEKHNVSDVVLPTGSGKNSVLLDLGPEERKYTLKNFYVFDQDGKKYNLDEHPEFKITGTVHYSELQKPAEEQRKDNFSFKITDITIEKK